MMAICLRQVSIVLVILIIRACSVSLPAAAAEPAASTPADRRRLNAEVTESVRDSRSSSGTRPPCRLMARDPYLSNRVRQLSTDGNVHLIKYTLQFPDGSNSNTTGPYLGSI